jgi:hypothetical protein
MEAEKISIAEKYQYREFQSMSRHRFLPIVFGSALVLAAMGQAHALVSVDFESAPGSGYDLYYGATRTTDQALSPTHSVQLSLPAVGSDQQLVRIIPSGFKLGNIKGSFSAYLPAGGTLAPYMEFGVDTNHNNSWGPGDSLVIAFIGGPFSTATWFQTGLDPSTLVHVVDARPGLTPGTYDAGGTQNTLASLASIPLGDLSGQNWGDLSVLRVYVGDGAWPGITSFNSYVDNVLIDQIPEPTTMTLLGAGLVGLAAARRRRR